MYKPTPAAISNQPKAPAPRKSGFVPFGSIQ
jgi:hypothetical protein